MGTHAIPLEPERIGVVWALSQHFMHLVIIHGIGPLAQTVIEVREGPHREAFGVRRGGTPGRRPAPGAGSGSRNAQRDTGVQDVVGLLRRALGTVATLGGLG